MRDIKAPNLRLPTPGQSRWSHDIDITLNKLKEEQRWNTYQSPALHTVLEEKPDTSTNEKAK